MQVTINATLEDISQASIAIEEALRRKKVGDEDRMRALLTLEEVLALLVENAPANGKITVGLSSNLYGSNIYISSKGQQIDLASIFNFDGFELSEGEMSAEAEDHIREIFLRSQSDHLNASYRRGINRIKLCVTRSEKVGLINALIGVALGLVVGMLVRLTCSHELAAHLSEYIFSPMYSIFLSAIRMLMAPLVFFSLVSSLIGLSDLRSLERLGAKVFGLYLMTALFAAFITMGVMTLLKPGEFGSMVGVFETASNLPESNFSPLGFFTHIVPDSFMGPFVETDMLQVLFLAVCFGLTASTLGKNSLPICTFVECMNDLFSKLMDVVAKAIPLAVFGSMANMIISMDVKSTLLVLSLFGTIVLCIVLMVCVYALLLLINGMNPIHVFRSHADAVVTAASSFSTNAALSVAMRCCRQDGVSPRIYSFSIPFGSSINMDGQSIFFMSTVLFLAHICGVELGVGTMATLVATVLLMGLATPSAPGAALACQAMLLSMVGVPSGSLVMILVLESLTDPLIVALETICDGVITMLVAKSEGEINKE